MSSVMEEYIRESIKKERLSNIKGLLTIGISENDIIKALKATKEEILEAKSALVPASQ